VEGSRQKIFHARGKRETTSRTRARLKRKIRNRDGISVMSDHPELIGKTSAKGTLGNGESWLGIGDAVFLANATDALSGKLPASPGEGLSDAAVAAEAGGGHGLDESTDDVGETTYGRRGPDQCAVGGRVGMA
jgi:hypothetical protein